MNIDGTIRRLHYAHVDGQSSLSSPAFYTPAYYPLSRTFLPLFFPAFTRCHSRIPHSRFLPIAVGGYFS